METLMGSNPPYLIKVNFGVFRALQEIIIREDSKAGQLRRTVNPLLRVRGFESLSSH